MIYGLIRIAAAVAGGAAVYVDSLYTHTPGIGFAVGLILIFGAALPWRSL
jgi:hypothetical protein